MYQCLPSFVLGFHGCDKSTGEDILSGKIVHEYSENKYDWLGSGIYFWENDPNRARNWANEQCARKLIKEPFIIGAVIDLKKCLNLLQIDALESLIPAYNFLNQTYKSSGYKNFPRNKSLSGKDRLIRNLDCAVIETLHRLNTELKEAPYDTVRGVFFEGKDLYPGAGFKEKNHIQICVRNRNCIKGYFRSREKDEDTYPDVVNSITTLKN